MDKIAVYRMGSIYQANTNKGTVSLSSLIIIYCLVNWSLYTLC
jgi:hypothetical protein